jgi:hypothetical protein
VIKISHCIFVLVSVWLGAIPTHAFESVPDLSPVRFDRVEFQWQSVVTRRAQTDEFHQMNAQLNNIEFQLDLQRYLSKNVRLYFVVPYDTRALSAADALRIRWLAQGRLAAGQAIADQRVLVFQGVINEPIWRERLSLSLQVDSRRFNPPFNTQPRFEIELIR